MDEGADHYDYLGIEHTGDSWTLAFDRGNIQVEMRNDQLAVTRIEGPASESAKDQVYAYRERPEPEPPRFVFPFMEIGEPSYEAGTLAVMTGDVWTGPLATQRAESRTCHIEVFNSKGERVYTGQDVTIPVPEHEAMRAGTHVDFGILEPVPDAATADVICT
ncbi:MAG: hypothetical protein M3N53_12940 [Actinomycetota bacterium]|nr:hypothetical protein [Actinomycetota bacterium]